MAAATAVFAPASGSATARFLHHRRRHFRHNHSCGLAIARSPSSWCARIRCRLRPVLPSSRGYGRGAPLVPASDHWGNWTFLLSAVALSLWSEKRAPAGKGKKAHAGAGALVSVLLGLAASSAGVVAADAPAYRAALDFLLPLAVPLLLFRAGDLRRPLRSAGAPMRAFLLGSVATAIGTLAAFRLVPMRSLGPDSSKIAVALMCRHIGGAFSYVAACEAFEVSSSAMDAGLAAGNAISAVYFTAIFALAAKIPAEESESKSTGEDSELPLANMIPAAKTAMAVAAAFAICRAGMLATTKLEQLGIQGPSLPFLTAVVVVALSNFIPSQIRKLAPSDDTLALIGMQVLFAVVGANGSIVTAISTAPSIFAFAFVQVAVHLLLTLGMGKLLGFDRKLMLVVSAANIGGPTSACGVAAVKGWISLVAPGILGPILGIAIIASIGAALGALLFHLCSNLRASIGKTLLISLGGLVTFVGVGVVALAAKIMK